MSKLIDYYYSLMSPWAYLGGPGLERIAAEAGATVDYKPVDLPKVFSVSGGTPLAQRPWQRKAYRFTELRRWRDYLGMPLTLEPKYFPVPHELASRLVVAAQRRGADAGRLSNACLRAVWAEERDLSERETLRTIAAENDMDADALLAAADDPATGEAYVANTDEAIERGVFGSPTYVYRDELFWGQDRLDFLARALAAEPA